MRLCSVRMRGLGPFLDEVNLDMADLGDALLVAVCGDNGEGKSTFLEFALPGAFYRHTPSQGSLKDRAKSRDALLEVVVAGKDRFTIRHLVGGSVVLDAAGAPVYATTLVSNFDAWAAKTLPPEEVLLASTFGAQGSRGFLGASPSDRKGILLRALGISRYEGWAKRAGESARSSKQAVEVTRARLEELRRAGGDVAEAERVLAKAVVDEKQLDDELTRAKTELADLEGKVRAAEAATATHATHLAKQVELRARVQSLQGKLDDIQARIAACTRTLSQEAAIRAAATKLAALQSQLAESEQQRTALTSREEAAQGRGRQAKTQADGARQHQARVALRIAELEQLLAKGAEITRAAADLAEVDGALATLREGVTSAQADLDQVTSETVAGAEGRIQNLTTGLGLVVTEAKTLAAAQGIAKESLREDAETLQQASERPARLAAARKRVEQCRGLLSSAEKRQQALAALARRAGEVTAARDQLSSLQKELEQHTATLRDQDAQAEAASNLVRKSEMELDELQKRHAELTREAEGLRTLADQLPNIALAASKLEERRVQQAEVSGELEAATWALSELGPAPARPTVPDLAPPRERLAQAEKAARAAHQAVGVAANRLEGARTVAQQILDLEQKQRGEEAELADWSRLAEDLGRNGLQAAEIDGCGPELTAMVNDLLHHCHGPRWSVRIDTQKLSADGKKTVEGCQVTVIDSVEGREDEGSKYSGGQKVIIGEACALGLSMLAAQRSGLRGITLVRDETGSALDPGNAEAYIRMLRRAALQIGADRVLFVCHNPEVSALADARITVTGGKLVVDAQARRAVA